MKQSDLESTVRDMLRSAGLQHKVCKIRNVHVSVSKNMNQVR